MNANNAGNVVKDSAVPIQAEDRPASANDEASQTIEYAVQLRGEKIGVIKVRMSADEAKKMTDNDRVLLEAVGERAALALDSARLLEEAQRRAAKEQAISEVSSKIGAAISLDNIMQTTLREMGRILPGAEISIQVENEELEQD